jgi:hypothetical protein
MIPAIPADPATADISRDRDRAGASRRPRTSLQSRRAGNESFAAARPDHQR